LPIVGFSFYCSGTPATAGVGISLLETLVTAGLFVVCSAHLNGGPGGSIFDAPVATKAGKANPSGSATRAISLSPGGNYLA